MKRQKEYLGILKQIRLERGEFCESCGEKAKYIHHIIPVSESKIHSNLIFEPSNMIILCDNCHSLMHPLLRNVSDWKRARKDRGQMINHLN
ncbi:MAG: HNH endonuclease [Candidatus Omnitrophica bacterium]|nr:HNH endonuclease [Candidatus Omnitrophota bacterium]